jgi:hypothetical protein
MTCLPSGLRGMDVCSGRLGARAAPHRLPPASTCGLSISAWTKGLDRILDWLQDFLHGTVTTTDMPRLRGTSGFGATSRRQGAALVPMP